LFKEFIHKEEHFNVCLDAKKIPDIGKIVKEIGVSARKICRYDVSFILYRFGNEAFVPFKIADDPLFLPGT
jgi:hypothetical protein